MDSESPHSITVTVEQPQWHSAVTEPATICLEAAHAVLARCGETARQAGPCEAGILLTDDATVTILNREWRGQDRPTNVLSFPAGGEVFPPGEPRPLGDVVVALETVMAEAAAAGRSCGDHLAHLVVHGFLHLLGHDHESEAEALRMEGLETAILAGLGIADPYREAAA